LWLSLSIGVLHFRKLQQAQMVASGAGKMVLQSLWLSRRFRAEGAAWSGALAAETLLSPNPQP
jgi:hypothetical protein